MTTSSSSSSRASSSSSRVRKQKRNVFRAVFPTDIYSPAHALSGSLPPSSSLSSRSSRSATATTRSVTASSSSSSSTTTTTATIIPSASVSASGRHATFPRGHTAQYSASAAASDQQRWDRAWHAVTSRIQLPSSVAVEDSFGTLAPQSQDDLDGQFYESLATVLDPRAAVPRAPHTDDVFAWHGAQVRQHFLHHVLPLLAACTSQRGDPQVLLGIVDTLEAAHRQYLYGLMLIVRGLHDDASADAAVAKFRRDLHALVSNSWTPGLMQALRGVLQRTLRIILASRGNHATAKGLGPDWARGMDAGKSRDDLFRLLESLQKVGLAGDKFHVFFAEVMDSCMQDYIKETYSGVWKRPKAAAATRDDSSSRPGTGPFCMDHLADWVDNCYGRLAVEVLSRLGCQVAWSDIERWREIAIGRLASLRMRELFDIVLHWPQSVGGIDDLGFAVTTPQRRLQLTDTFSATLQRRLLHPGRSTLDILRTYISVIKTFHALDHSEVLLDRVVPALKLCLWMRDDAIRIVVTGLLADHAAADPEGENRGKLVELAAILDEASQQQRRHADEEELDWNDMSWVPDPVDAGVNYKRPKNEDIIGTLIGALGLQDVFIKEFQGIVAERLLSRRAGFQQEIKVLGLLKKRFGEAALQNCDVMIRDIADSKRVDAQLTKTTMGDGGVTYHAKILSRLFWPSLPQDGFVVPPPVAAVRRKYEAGFERLKSSRKLRWLDALGSATVSLELQDRTVDVRCKTYEAAVIHAFSNTPRQHFNDLWQTLQMDEDVLDGALRFWVSKRVLREVGGQTYQVLEVLETQEGGIERETEKGGVVRKKKGDGEKEKGMYWQFVVGMLTNSSPAMGLGQIGMMMRMLIADCGWSDEELAGFLRGKVEGGELEFSGGKYRLPKK